jgi:hypothetical protein
MKGHLREGETNQMRSILINTFVTLAIAATAAFGADNTIGKWKLNIEQSTYTPAPMPVKSLTITREAAGGGAKVTTTGQRADGTAINATYTAKYDGTPSSVTGTGSPYDLVSIKQVDANTLTDERKKTGGKYHVIGRTVISNGGKTMTAITKGVNGDGQVFASTLVFDKQ